MNYCSKRLDLTWFNHQHEFKHEKLGWYNHQTLYRDIGQLGQYPTLGWWTTGYQCVDQRSMCFWAKTLPKWGQHGFGSKLKKTKSENVQDNKEWVLTSRLASSIYRFGLNSKVDPVHDVGREGMFFVFLTTIYGATAEYVETWADPCDVGWVLLTVSWTLKILIKWDFRG